MKAPKKATTPVYVLVDAKGKPHDRGMSISKHTADITARMWNSGKYTGHPFRVEVYVPQGSKP